MKRIIYKDGDYKDVPDEAAWEFENDPDYERTEDTPPTDMLEKAKEFYERGWEAATFGSPDTLKRSAVCERMRDFASERVAEAVAEERRRIAADLCLFRPDIELKAAAAFNRYIEKLRDN